MDPNDLSSALLEQKNEKLSAEQQWQQQKRELNSVIIPDSVRNGLDGLSKLSEAFHRTDASLPIAQRLAKATSSLVPGAKNIPALKGSLSDLVDAAKNKSYSAVGMDLQRRSGIPVDTGAALAQAASVSKTGPAALMESTRAKATGLAAVAKQLNPADAGLANETANSLARGLPTPGLGDATKARLTSVLPAEPLDQPVDHRIPAGVAEKLGSHLGRLQQLRQPSNLPQLDQDVTSMVSKRGFPLPKSSAQLQAVKEGARMPVPDFMPEASDGSPLTGFKASTALHDYNAQRIRDTLTGTPDMNATLKRAATVEMHAKNLPPVSETIAHSMIDAPPDLASQSNAAVAPYAKAQNIKRVRFDLGLGQVDENIKKAGLQREALKKMKAGLPLTTEETQAVREPQLKTSSAGVMGAAAAARAGSTDLKVLADGLRPSVDALDPARSTTKSALSTLTSLSDDSPTQVRQKGQQALSIHPASARLNDTMEQIRSAGGNPVARTSTDLPANARFDRGSLPGSADTNGELLHHAAENVRKSAQFDYSMSAASDSEPSMFSKLFRKRPAPTQLPGPSRLDPVAENAFETNRPVQPDIRGRINELAGRVKKTFAPSSNPGQLSQQTINEAMGPAAASGGGSSAAISAQDMGSGSTEQYVPQSQKMSMAAARAQAVSSGVQNATMSAAQAGEKIKPTAGWNKPLPRKVTAADDEVGNPNRMLDDALDNDASENDIAPNELRLDPEVVRELNTAGTNAPESTAPLTEALRPSAPMTSTTEPTDPGQAAYEANAKIAVDNGTDSTLESAGTDALQAESTTMNNFSTAVSAHDNFSTTDAITTSVEKAEKDVIGDDGGDDGEVAAEAAADAADEGVGGEALGVAGVGAAIAGVVEGLSEKPPPLPPLPSFSTTNNTNVSATTQPSALDSEMVA